MNQQAPRDRRPFHTEPGDSLLLPGSPIEASFAYNRYQHAMGVQHADLLTSTLVAVPVPVPPAGAGPDHRWSGARPEFMWHPLMWLPEWVSGRAELDGREETDDEMVVRIAIQLAECGLYDVENGTWQDVLAVAGLDTDDPSDVDRVRSWLAGADDVLLDQVAEMVSDVMDMTPVATEETARHLEIPYEHLVQMMLEYDPLHAHRWAREAVPFLRECSYALASEAMLDALDDLSEGETGQHTQPMDGDAEGYAWTPDARRTLALTFIHLTGQFVRGAEQSDQLPAIASQVESFDGDDQALLAGPVSRFREVLESLRHRYLQTLEELESGIGELTGEGTEVPATT